MSREDGVKSKPASKELEDGLRNRLISAQEQIMEKNKMVAQLQGEVGDMVRSKALQVTFRPRLVFIKITFSYLTKSITISVVLIRTVCEFCTYNLKI